jgi:putative SOS response-associated peptidase YedK
MCGRYVSPDQASIERAWSVHARDIAPFSQHFNVVPTSTVPLLRLDADQGGMELALARWGFIPHWWKQEKPPRLTHNARSEEAATKPMWRTPLSKARCLIPALGWYEWQVVERVDQQTGEVRKAKQPHFIRLPGGEPICFAGLMSYWRAPEADKGQLTCSILTCAAADSVAQVHDRMPVVLGDDAHANWLDKDLNDGAEAIAFAREHAIVEFAHYAVSDRVNRPKEIDASLIERL